MNVRVGLWRKLSAEELMFLKCGIGEDSWESLQVDQTSLETASRSNQSILKDREAWNAAVRGVAKSWTQLSNWTELNCNVSSNLPSNPGHKCKKDLSYLNKQID